MFCLLTEINILLIELTISPTRRHVVRYCTSDLQTNNDNDGDNYNKCYRNGYSDYFMS